MYKSKDEVDLGKKNKQNFELRLIYYNENEIKDSAKIAMGKIVKA